jgi:hypothetical protein
MKHKLFLSHSISLSHSLQVIESVQFYFNKIDIIKMPDYLPDKDDILFSRVRTSGIVTERYNIDGTTFEMYDVGGQRNERKKWIHCFEGLFSLPLSLSLSLSLSFTLSLSLSLSLSIRCHRCYFRGCYLRI